MHKPLEGQIAIVTGGARGIGLAIARKLDALGARVSIWDINPDLFDRDKAGFTPGALRAVDVSNFESVTNGFAADVDEFGRVDIMVNNAGVNGPVTPSWEYSLEDWDRVIAIDLTAVFYCCRTAINHMREKGGGRIVNVASMAGKEGVQFISGYSAAKAGVIGFTKAAAKELAQDNVYLNCIAPAMVETELFSEMTEEHIRASKAKIPMGRFLQVEEIASMVGFIVGPECTFTTGFVFDLSGGRATY